MTGPRGPHIVRGRRHNSILDLDEVEQMQAQDDYSGATDRRGPVQQGDPAPRDTGLNGLPDEPIPH